MVSIPSQINMFQSKQIFNLKDLISLHINSKSIAKKNKSFQILLVLYSTKNSIFLFVCLKA